MLTGSYSHHYRVMLPKLLDALEFRCNNTAYRPVMDAVELLHRYKDRDGRFTHYERAERVPLDGVVKADWRAAVVDDRGRVERVSYELCVLGALRNAVRRREIWVAGAKVWRDPEADLPVDFDLHRDVHYTAIAQPTDPTEFVASLRTRLDTALAGFAEAHLLGFRDSQRSAEGTRVPPASSTATSPSSHAKPQANDDPNRVHPGTPRPYRPVGQPPSKPATQLRPGPEELALRRRRTRRAEAIPTKHGAMVDVTSRPRASRIAAAVTLNNDVIW